MANDGTAAVRGITNYATHRRRFIGLLTGLLLDATAGITLNTLIKYNPAHPSAFRSLILGLHILIAAGIILGGCIQLIAALRTRVVRLASGVGLLCSLAAFAGGVITVNGGKSSAVFAMAVFFLLAIVAYGYGLLKLAVLSAIQK